MSSIRANHGGWDRIFNPRSLLCFDLGLAQSKNGHHTKRISLELWLSSGEMQPRKWSPLLPASTFICSLGLGPPVIKHKTPRVPNQQLEKARDYGGFLSGLRVLWTDSFSFYRFSPQVPLWELLCIAQTGAGHFRSLHRERRYLAIGQIAWPPSISPNHWVFQKPEQPSVGNLYSMSSVLRITVWKCGKG